MKKNLKAELSRIHSQIARQENWREFASDFEIHKKLLLAFQPGPAFYWILNTGFSVFEMMSPEVEQVLGYKPEEATFQFMLDKIHPEDVPFLLNFENAIGEFVEGLPAEKRRKYKFQYDFRMKRADGKYVRILNQLVVIAYETEANLIKTFGVHADISHLKTDTRPKLCFIGFDGEPSYFDIDTKMIYEPAPSIFSPREREILELVSEGKTSREIAEILYISKLTVDTHRKQMLRKAKCKSASELISKAILEAWI